SSDLTQSGSQIGTANIQEIVHVSGTKGSANAVYRMYLYNIKMSSGQSFSNVKSVTRTGTAMADVVLTSGQAVLKETSYAPLVFDLGAPAVKSLKNAEGEADSSFTYTAA